VDSKSGIQTLASNKQATIQTVKEARKTIKLLNRQGKTVSFQWVPSHVGIHGNETTDLLAKKEPHLKKTHTPNFETIKRHIKQRTQQKFSQEAIASSINLLTGSFLSCWCNLPWA
jgi:hypothetical protein